MNIQVVLQRPFNYVAQIRSPMRILVKNSTSILTVTLLDDNGDRITSGTVLVSVVRPDTKVKTVTDMAVPHVGNGVYRVRLPKTAVPVVGAQYQAQLSIVSGSDELHPTIYFDVYEG